MSHALTWTNNEPKAYSLYVDRCTDGIFLTNVVSFPLSQGATSFTDTTAVSNTQYFYRVRTVNASGASVSRTLAASPIATYLWKVVNGSWQQVVQIQGPVCQLWTVSGGQWINTGVVLSGASQLWKVINGAWSQLI